MIFKWSDLRTHMHVGRKFGRVSYRRVGLLKEPQGVLSSISGNKTSISSPEMCKHWERLQGAKSHSGGISTEGTEHRFRRRSVPNRCRTIIYLFIYFISFFSFFIFLVLFQLLLYIYKKIEKWVLRSQTPHGWIKK